MSCIMEADPESCSMDPCLWYGGTAVLTNVQNWNKEQQPRLADILS